MEPGSNSFFTEQPNMMGMGMGMGMMGMGMGMEAPSPPPSHHHPQDLFELNAHASDSFSFGQEIPLPTIMPSPHYVMHPIHAFKGIYLLGCGTRKIRWN